jgi:hypothetical protein
MLDIPSTAEAFLIGFIPHSVLAFLTIFFGAVAVLVRLCIIAWTALKVSLGIIDSWEISIIAISSSLNSQRLEEVTEIVSVLLWIRSPGNVDYSRVLLCLSMP